MKRLAASTLICAMATMVLGTADVHSNSHLVRRPLGCPRGWTQFNDRCFLYNPRPMSWARAEKHCLSIGANLASVHNIMEYHAIQRLMTASHQYRETWIGGTDAQETNLWFWSDGRPFQYINWCRGEPNYYRKQHCLQINYGHSRCWDNLECKFHRPSVCARKM